MRRSSKTLQSNPRLTPSGPIVLWYGKRGGSKAASATHFSVIPPGTRSRQKFEIPAKYRKSVSSRIKFVEEVLKAFQLLAKKRKLAREKAKREALKRETEEAAKKLALKKKKAKAKPVKKAKAKAPVSKKLSKLEKENQKLRAELRATKLKIEAQKLKRAKEKLLVKLEDLKKKKLKPQKPLAPKKSKREVSEEVEPEKEKAPKKKEKKAKLAPLELHQIEALKKAGIHELHKGVPKLSDIETRYHPKIKSFDGKNYEKKQLVGKVTKIRSQEKLDELKNKWRNEGLSRKEVADRLSDKEKTQREGIDDYSQKTIDISKLHIDFDQQTPVLVYGHLAKSVAITLREYFRKPAEEFLNEMRDQSENTYILRVKTRNFMSGQESRDEGIGTARFKLWSKLPDSTAKALRLEYPNLSDDEILKIKQTEQLNTMIDDLFNYFVDRYETYLGRKMIDSLGVTGFTMEVVNKIVTSKEAMAA